MEIIRRDSDYAIRALLALARGKEGYVSCGVLAEDCNIPRALTHKLLRRLVGAGLVESRFGRSGGFRLARPPEKIPLIEILTAIQDGVTVARCVLCEDTCDHKRGCPLSVQWGRLQSQIERFLRTTTVAAVLRATRPRPKGPPIAKCDCPYPSSSK